MRVNITTRRSARFPAIGGWCLAAAALLLGGAAIADDLRAREGHMSYNLPISRESGGNVQPSDAEAAAEPAQSETGDTVPPAVGAAGAEAPPQQPSELSRAPAVRP